MPQSVELTHEGGWGLLHAIDTKLGVIIMLLLVLIITIIIATSALVQAISRQPPMQPQQAAPTAT